MAAADAFIDTGLYGAGYRHFHLDDCWSIVKRNATGHIQADPAGFPNGMKTVIDYAHSKNLTFGEWHSQSGRLVLIFCASLAFRPIHLGW
jgi:alpha-galactosidase